MKLKFYNLFVSFKKKLCKTKHIPTEEKALLKIYNKSRNKWLLKYARKIGKALVVLVSCALVFFGAKKFLSKYECRTFVITGDVNLRDAPNFKSNVVRVLHSQEKVQGSVNGKWLEVKDNGQTYFVSKSMTKPYNSGSAMLLHWTVTIVELIAKAIVAIATFITLLYKKYEAARAVSILLASVLLFKLYNKLAKEKDEIISAILEKLCPNCGSYYVKSQGPYEVSESSSLRTKISYIPFSTDTRNSRGDIISTQNGETPVSEIVNVHTVLTRTDFACQKCGHKYYTTDHFSYED